MKFGVIECNVGQNTKQGYISDAMKTLTSAGFRLYYYIWSMAELEGGRAMLPLCREDVIKYTGFGKRTYYAAIKDLESNGYIKPKEGKRRYYLFDGNGD